MRPSVFITFDVECGMGGAWGDSSLHPVPPSRCVWGEYGGRRMGIPLISDILGRSNLQATFFVEAFNEEQGYAGDTEMVCRFLVDAGHDVQLHVHPNHRHYAAHRRGEQYKFSDNLAELSAEEQRSLIEEGAGRIGRWTGRPPVAFRAGNMAANEETLGVLSAAGIRIDSSYTFPYLGGQCPFHDTERYNGSKQYGDVLEVALSGFEQAHFPGLRASKPLDLVGISFEECRDAIRKVTAAGADAVLILHSFSLFKVRNTQYDGGRLDWVVTGRFRRLCEWLGARREEYPVRTFAQLATAVADGRYEAKAVPPCRLPLRRALARKAVQGLNRFHWF